MTDIDKIMQQQPKKIGFWKLVNMFLLMAIFPLPMALLLKKIKNNEK